MSKAAPGNARMQEIASAIAEGANTFLMSEYKILAIFIVVLFALIAVFIKTEMKQRTKKNASNTVVGQLKTHNPVLMSEGKLFLGF